MLGRSALSELHATCQLNVVEFIDKLRQLFGDNEQCEMHNEVDKFLETTLKERASEYWNSDNKFDKYYVILQSYEGVNAFQYCAQHNLIPLFTYLCEKLEKLEINIQFSKMDIHPIKYALANHNFYIMQLIINQNKKDYYESKERVAATTLELISLYLKCKFFSMDVSLIFELILEALKSHIVLQNSEIHSIRPLLEKRKLMLSSEPKNLNELQKIRQLLDILEAQHPKMIEEKLTSAAKTLRHFR